MVRYLDDHQRASLNDVLRIAKRNVINTEIDSGGDPGTKTGLQTRLHFLKSMLTEKDIANVFMEIRSENFAKLLGLCVHFCYWCIFGSYNEVPLDQYHLK